MPGTDSRSNPRGARYRCSPEVRQECIALYGASCAACGFWFEAVHGELGKGFIHVHHVVPVSQLGAGYRLDPVKVMPFYPNCHAMAHQGVISPRSVEDLRSIIAEHGLRRGKPRVH